jgi:hypothetical protein
MRTRETSQGLTCRTTADTYVTLLGFDMPEDACDGLLGFAIQRAHHVEGETSWMRELKTFAATGPERPPGTSYSTRQHRIQGFTWSDFSAKPGREIPIASSL